MWVHENDGRKSCKKLPSVKQNTPLGHTHRFNGPLSRTTQVSRYQKGKTNLDFSEARDSEWQWHQVGHMQVCISLQTNNHASTPPLGFFAGRMPFLPPNQQCQSTEGNPFGIHMVNITIEQIFDAKCPCSTFSCATLYSTIQSSTLVMQLA